MSKTVEVGEILGTTKVTLREKMRDKPHFPIVKRGANGVLYEFDTRLVRDFLDGLDAADQVAAEARADKLAAWRLTWV